VLICLDSKAKQILPASTLDVSVKAVTNVPIRDMGRYAKCGFQYRFTVARELIDFAHIFCLNPDVLHCGY
jgi:hypothetical protein